MFALAVLPSAALAWSTWQLLDRDRNARQQSADRLNNASLLVVSRLREVLSEARRSLAEGRAWPPGAVAVTVHKENVIVTPSERVAFLPVRAPLPEPPDESAVNAATLLAEGRRLAEAGRSQAALEAFGRILTVRPASIAGTPSWVAAGYWRTKVLTRTGQEAQARNEANRLAENLAALAPHLDAALYQLYAEDLEHWIGRSLPDEPAALSGAIDLLWRRWSARAYPVDASGHELVSEQGQWRAIALWETSGETLRAVVATRHFVESEWIPQISSIARAHQASVALDARRRGGPPSFSHEAKDLPWPITLYDASGSADATNQQLLFAITASFTLVLVAACAATRAIVRELAVARQQSDFVAAVSHEFRTPLTSLKHFLELLREQPSLGEQERRQCYDAQARAVNRLSGLVESLLDFGRLDAGAYHYQLTRQDCAALVQSVANDFAAHAAAAGRRIAVDVSATAPVDVDVEAFSRALWNLLDNAMKYSPADSTIDVDLHTADGYVCVDVRDRGIGVGADEARDIFRRFHRGAEARSRAIRGTGLGLAMVVEIMKAHGGRVDLDSHPGQGSTFTLVLPSAV